MHVLFNSIILLMLHHVTAESPLNPSVSAPSVLILGDVTSLNVLLGYLEMLNQQENKGVVGQSNCTETAARLLLRHDSHSFMNPHRFKG